VVGLREPQRAPQGKADGDRETATRIAQAIRGKLARRELNLGDGADGEILRSYAATWLQHAKLTLKASTITFYDGHLAQHILPALGNRKVRDLRRMDCRQLVFDCRAKGLKVSTVRGIARTLSTILSQAVEDEILPANPALRMGKHLRQADDPEPQIDPFTRAEASHVLDVAREQLPEWCPWMLTGFRTGMRLGELLGLQWGDIDWRARTPPHRQKHRQGPADDAEEPSASANRSVTTACGCPAPVATPAACGLAEEGRAAAAVGLRVGLRNGAR
jgi:integrase